MNIFSRRLLNPDQEFRITSAIKEAELKTSGEIRIHVNNWCKGDPQIKARNMFEHLEMHQTEERNGVLIYVALKEHKFAIIGDTAIHEKVDANFWELVAAQMSSEFKQGRIVEGIVKGVQEAGEQLQKYFPRSKDDINELPDEISYG